MSRQCGCFDVFDSLAFSFIFVLGTVLSFSPTDFAIYNVPNFYSFDVL